MKTVFVDEKLRREDAEYVLNIIEGIGIRSDTVNLLYADGKKEASIMVNNLSWNKIENFDDILESHPEVSDIIVRDSYVYLPKHVRSASHPPTAIIVDNLNTGPYDSPMTRKQSIVRSLHMVSGDERFGDDVHRAFQESVDYISDYSSDCMSDNIYDYLMKLAGEYVMAEGPIRSEVASRKASFLSNIKNFIMMEESYRRVLKESAEDSYFCAMDAVMNSTLPPNFPNREVEERKLEETLGGALSLMHPTAADFYDLVRGRLSGMTSMKKKQLGPIYKDALTFYKDRILPLQPP